MPTSWEMGGAGYPMPQAPGMDPRLQNQIAGAPASQMLPLAPMPMPMPMPMPQQSGPVPFSLAPPASAMRPAPMQGAPVQPLSNIPPETAPMSSDGSSPPQDVSSDPRYQPQGDVQMQYGRVAQQQGGGFGNWAADRSDTLLSLGNHLLTPPALRTKYGTFNDVMAAGRSDRAERDKKASTNQTTAWLQQRFGLTPEEARAAASNKDVMAFYMQQASGGEAYTLGPDEVRYQGGKEVARGPASSPKPTDDMRELAAINAERTAAGMPPLRLDEWITQSRRAGASSNNVVLSGEKSFDQTLGKGMAEDYKSILNEGLTARSSLNALSVMDQASQDPDFYSGAGSAAVMAIKRGYVALGGDPDGAASMEAFQTQARKVALDSMGGSLGSGFSNADRDFVLEQVPNLGNTPEGNKSIIAINKKIAQRKIEIAEFARNYAKENDGRIDDGFYDALARWAEENPLFPAPPDNRQSQPQAPQGSFAQPGGIPTVQSPGGGASGTTRSGLQFQVNP